MPFSLKQHESPSFSLCLWIWNREIEEDGVEILGESENAFTCVCIMGRQRQKSGFSNENLAYLKISEFGFGFKFKCLI